MKPEPPAMTFRKALLQNILATITKAKQNDTLGMSLECLQQCTMPPNPALHGAPADSDRCHLYNQMFRDVVENDLPKNLQSFILK